ncbi:MAG: ABC transporter ATP-binding protein [Oscillospiraceae bacterium]
MKKTLKRIFSYTKPYMRYFITAIISAFAGVILSLVVPILTGEAVDAAVGKSDVDFASLGNTAIKMVIIILLSTVFQWIMALCTNKLSYNTARDIRKDIFAKLNKLPVSYIDSHSKGNITGTVINDMEIVSDGLLQGFTQLFTGIVTILGTLCLMFSISVRITVVVIIMTPISLFAASKITKLSHDSFSKQSQCRGNMNGFIDEMVGNQQLVKAFAYEEYAEQDFEKLNNDIEYYGARATFFASMSNPTTRFVNGLIYAVAGLTGALSVVSGRFSVGNLISFLSYANQYTKPFNEISGVIAEFQNAVASAERIFGIIDEQEETPDDNLPELEKCDGTVEMKNVSFSYTPDRKLIENFSVSVKQGEKVAIVGRTGCGKTTIINLILRFYDIDSGEIRVSGHNIKEIKRDSLRSVYGMVLQDTWLFSGTIAENIAYSRPDATMEEIIEAAKAVHAHSFIKRLSDGYNTHIGENGGALSQGQKQLISIARIMLANPPMLILDEATSNIDIRTEQYVQRAFDKIMKGKTVFIIAHRLSTIKNADTILVMNDGNIIEQGNHNQLMAKGGFYAEMYQSRLAEV